MPIILVHGRWRQEDQTFTVILAYRAPEAKILGYSIKQSQSKYIKTLKPTNELTQQQQTTGETKEEKKEDF